MDRIEDHIFPVVGTGVSGNDPASEKLEIIRLVERSHLPVRRTLDKLGIPSTTFYRWYDRYRIFGGDGLEDRTSGPGRVRLSRAFSSSSCFNRLTSDGIRPAYFSNLWGSGHGGGAGCEVGAQEGVQAVGGDVFDLRQTDPAGATLADLDSPIDLPQRIISRRICRVDGAVQLPNPTFYNRNAELEVGLTQNGDEARIMETAVQNVSFLAMPHMRYRHGSPH